MINNFISKILKNFMKSGKSIAPPFSCIRFTSTVSLPQTRTGEKYELSIPENDPIINTKLLKVAIIGTPNSGKSTLINRIVQRRIFAMSKKVHTTRCRARAVHIEGNTQLIFLDTPGLVSATESQKYKLSQKFMCDGEDAIGEADVIGVVHDTSNIYTRNKLDSKVLRLLHLFEEKESFLILNKIDTVKSKRILLNLSTALTGGQLRNYKEPVLSNKISESAVLDIIKSKVYWKKFSDVFMVSALLGEGTSDIKSYLLNAAQPRKWIFDAEAFTDQEPVQIIEEAIRSKLLDNLPHEVPYKLEIELEYLDMNVNNCDYMAAVVLIHCATPRTERFIKGNGGHRIKLIAREAEQSLKETFLTDVRLKIVIKNKKSQ